jgi:hypothetical protein
MVGYTLKYISFDQMILDMPYPSYQVFEYIIVASDEDADDQNWTVYS